MNIQENHQDADQSIEDTFDPFDPIHPLSLLPDLKKELDNKVHLRLQQRSAKKSITIVEGLRDDVAKDIIPKLRTKLGCSGTPKSGAIQFSGDQRRKIMDYLVDQKLVTKRDIVLHGY